MDFPAPGTRVVVRYRLPPGFGHPMTDVIGVLDVVGDAVVVRTQRGEVVQVARDRVVAVKALAARPIRTSEIRSLEAAAADAWPGLEQEWIDGWLCRSGRGFTRRANSAVPLDVSASSEAVDEISKWYEARNSRVWLALPDRLGAAPAFWPTVGETRVMTAEIDTLVLPEGSASVVRDAPDPLWGSLYHYHGEPLPDFGVEVVSAVRDGVAGYLRLGDASTTLAIARAAVTTAPDGRVWVGLTAVEVHPDHRRRGLGSVVCVDAIRWGREHGATHAYLQVEAENTGAARMYEGLGFVDHHRYRYASPS